MVSFPHGVKLKAPLNSTMVVLSGETSEIIKSAGMAVRPNSVRFTSTTLPVSKEVTDCVSVSVPPASGPMLDELLIVTDPALETLVMQSPLTSVIRHTSCLAGAKVAFIRHSVLGTMYLTMIVSFLTIQKPKRVLRDK